MKLVGYVLKKFTGVFFGALMFFVMMLSITDLLMNLWNYIARQVSMVVVGKIMLLYIPKAVWYSVPIAVLVSTAFTLSDLYAKNELTAVFACGVSLARFTAPLLVVSFALSLGLFFFDDYVVVPTFSQKESMQKEALHKEASMNNDKIVIISNEGRIIYKAEYYDDGQKRLYNVFLIFRNEDMTFDCIIRADNALYVDGKWKLSNALEYVKQDEDIITVPVDDVHMELLTETPETFRNNTVSVETVTSREARQYIKHLEKAGLPTGEAKSVYYKKFTFPFVVFICSFLAIGLSGKTRKNVLVVSLALSVGAVVVFYVLQMVTMIMAKHGAIPPLFGPAFPVVFFIFISVVLLKYART